MLGLALELRRRGHTAALLTNPHFEPLVRQYDVEFIPLGTKEQFDACISNPDLWNPRHAFRHIFETIKPVFRQQYEIHAAHAGRPDVVGLSNCFGMGAFIAREKFHLPVVTVHLQPGVIWSDYEPPTLNGMFGPRWLKRWLYPLGEKLVIDAVVCPYLNAWRAELGLPPVRRITRWWNSPDGVLCLFPEWFAPPQRDWPQPLMMSDFPLWNHQSGDPLPAEAARFLDGGEPPIVFTPGSANSHGREFFAAAAQACRELNRRGVFLTPYADQVPQPLPQGLAHFPYIPLDLLLPRSAAFVHHGGVGSTSQGLLAGVPQVAVAMAHDQFDNGVRLRKLGVGDMLRHDRLSGPKLTAALRKLLDSPAVVSACSELSRKLSPRNGLARAADLLESRFAAQETGATRAAAGD